MKQTPSDPALFCPPLRRPRFVWNTEQQIVDIVNESRRMALNPSGLPSVRIAVSQHDIVLGKSLAVSRHVAIDCRVSAYSSRGTKHIQQRADSHLGRQ